MKSSLLLLAAALLTQPSAQSQTTAIPVGPNDAPPRVTIKEATPEAAAPVIVAPPGSVIEKKITTTTTTQPGSTVETRVNIPGPRAIVRKLDNLIVRRQLSVAPRTLPIVERVVVAPPATTEVTTRTVTPTRPVRIYNPERNVVVVQGEKEDRELPYVALPVLFVVAKDELLDEESAQAIKETAIAIKEISKESPNALFDIEGHTSTEGSDEMNMELSGKRAKRVLDELTTRYGVEPHLLTAHGYGENYPQYPNGTEAQLELDRRVLVVRTR